MFPKIMSLYVSINMLGWFNEHCAQNVQHIMLRSDPLDIKASILVIDQWRIETRA